MQEAVDILTKEGKPTGNTALKTEAHRLGLWHASVQIWILNSQQEVLLQKRAKDKDSYPNLWDISVAGHLSAGDTPVKAAQREIKEEIGIAIEERELIFLKTISKQKTPKPGFFDNEFNHLFAVKKDFCITDCKLQTEEVAAIKWVDLAEFKKQLYSIPQQFVPHGMDYYEYIISKLEQL